MLHNQSTLYKTVSLPEAKLEVGEATSVVALGNKMNISNKNNFLHVTKFKLK